MPASATPLPPVRVLIVDDEPANLLALEAVLQQIGATLVRAGSGQEALKKTMDEDYAAILLDVRMPGMDGFEAARLIRSRPRSRTTPILFVTAADSSDLAIEEGYAMGAVDFLTKPLIPAVLKAKVSFFIELQRSRNELRAAERLAVNERAFMSAVLEAVEDGIVACDPEGNLTLFNRATRELHGLPEARIPPTQWAEHYALYHSDARTPLRVDEVPLMRALAGERVRNAEMVVAPVGGPPRTLLASGQTLYEPSTGAKLGAVVSMHDVTAQREAQAARDAALLQRAARERAEASAEANAKFRAFFDQGSYFGAVLDLGGHVLEANQLLLETSGLKRGEIQGRAFCECLWTGMPDVVEAVRRGVADAAAGHRFRAELRYITFDGQRRFVDLIISPVTDQDGQVRFLAPSGIDVTDRRQAEAALRAGEARLRLATETGGVGVWSWQPQADRVTWESEILYGMFGLQPGDAPLTAQRFISEFLHPEDVAGFSAAIAATVEHGEALSFQGRYYRPPGRDLRWVEFSGSLQALPDGGTAQILGTARDITELMRAADAVRASEDRYRNLFESVDEGVCVIEMLRDARGRPVDYRFVEANPAFSKQTGLPDAVGHTIRELVPTLETHWFELYGGVADTGEPVRLVHEAKGLDRWFDVYANRVGGQGSQRVAVVVNDITERVRAEAGLRQVAAELAESDRRKTEFLATLAHELRNPLAPLRNGLHVLSQMPQSPAVLERARGMMDRQVSHMVRLIDDLLDIARVTTGKVELKRERIELRAVVDSAVEAVMPLIESAGHTLELRLPAQALWLDVDPTRLAQVLGNLLNNAAKYTAPGGRIELAARSEGADMLLTVSDTGVGIAADALGGVFQMFTQVGRNMDRAQGGLGIGLSLVRGLVELHGGSVTAASPGVGQGSTFSVRLPLAPAAAAPLAPSHAAPPAVTGAQPLRVLVVDDNEDAAESLAMILQMGGHVARVANDGDRAIQVVREFDPEIVFLDIGMPGKNGYDVARELRRDAARAQQPVLVALTGWGAEGDLAKSRAAGFDHHLTKPAEIAAVEKLLSGLARHRPPGGQPPAR